MTDTSVPQPGSPEAPIALGPGTGEPAPVSPPFDPADLPEEEPTPLPSLADVLARFSSETAGDRPVGPDPVSAPDRDPGGVSGLVDESPLFSAPAPVASSDDRSPAPPVSERDPFDRTPLFADPPAAPVAAEPVSEAEPVSAEPASEPEPVSEAVASEPAASEPAAEPEPAPASEPAPAFEPAPASAAFPPADPSFVPASEATPAFEPSDPAPVPVPDEAAASVPDELVPAWSAPEPEAAAVAEQPAASAVASEPSPPTREENAVPFDQDFLTPVEGVTISPPSAEDLEPVFLTAPTVEPTAIAQLGELNGKELGRRAVTVNEARIGKLEPGFGFGARFRSFAVLLVVTVIVATVVAAVLAISIELISVWANHAISKSAGS